MGHLSDVLVATELDREESFEALRPLTMSCSC
jgi:hypothetical protein